VGIKRKEKESLVDTLLGKGPGKNSSSFTSRLPASRVEKFLGKIIEHLALLSLSFCFISVSTDRLKG